MQFKRENGVILSMITDGENGITLLWKTITHCYEEKHQSLLMTAIAWIIFIYSEQKISFHHMRACVRIMIMIT